MAYRLRDVADLLGVPTAAAAANEEVRYKTTRSKRSKLVDPEEPEKPQRAYNYFIKENYPAIQKKFPNENKKIMTELAALWKETSSKDRKVVLACKRKRINSRSCVYIYMKIVELKERNS